jgi:hypothetical protein
VAVLRTNVEWWKARFAERVGNPYVYAGIYSPTNIRQGCDCSALAAHLLNGCLFGPHMTWQRVDPTRGNAWITTESWRPIEVGQRGPFGTITVARPQDIPADAVVKIALHHGPGGGANSHMWMECEGIRMESGGSKGTATGSRALAIDASYGNDWAYLPGPVDGVGPPPVINTTTYGIDISNHQREMDIAAVKREGFEFLFAKVSEGLSYKDPYWARNRDEARRHGLLLAGYHYVRPGSADAQADLFVSHLGDKAIPAMLDFEEGSGNIDQFWAVLRAIEARGAKVRLSYIPKWYWERIGKPDLSAVPGLFSSNYVNGSDYASRLYPGNSGAGWNPYGGATPLIWQFTSSAKVAGLLVDADAFKGTPDQLRSYLDSGTLDQGDDDMGWMQDREEVLLLLRNTAGVRRPSGSPFRINDDPFDTSVGFGDNADALAHLTAVEKLAVDYSDPEAIAQLLIVDGYGKQPDKFPNRQNDARLARLVLAKVSNSAKAAGWQWAKEKWPREFQQAGL